MKQSVSHYMMPYDREEDIEKTLRKLHLDGIENLIYGTEPALHPADGITLGCHLAYWPDWMDFYLGKKDFYEKDFPTKQSLIDTFGGTTVEAWIEKIRRNIRAALAEKPEYLVWHVAHCSLDEIWTRRFRYSSRDVLKAAAEVYSAVAEEVPPSVTVLFENIFWPGLYTLEPEEVDYFFSLLPVPPSRKEHRHHAGYGTPDEYEPPSCHRRRRSPLCERRGEPPGLHEIPHPGHPPQLLPLRRLSEKPPRHHPRLGDTGYHQPPHYLHRPAPPLHHQRCQGHRGLRRTPIRDPRTLRQRFLHTRRQSAPPDESGRPVEQVMRGTRIPLDYMDREARGAHPRPPDPASAQPWKRDDRASECPLLYSAG